MTSTREARSAGRVDAATAATSKISADAATGNRVGIFISSSKRPARRASAKPNTTDPHRAQRNGGGHFNTDQKPPGGPPSPKPNHTPRRNSHHCHNSAFSDHSCQQPARLRAYSQPDAELPSPSADGERQHAR